MNPQDSAGEKTLCNACGIRWCRQSTKGAFRRQRKELKPKDRRLIASVDSLPSLSHVEDDWTSSKLSKRDRFAAIMERERESFKLSKERDRERDRTSPPTEARERPSLLLPESREPIPASASAPLPDRLEVPIVPMFNSLPIPSVPLTVSAGYSAASMPAPSQQLRHDVSTDIELPWLDIEPQGLDSIFAPTSINLNPLYAQL
jgi:hypothetical protein